MKPGFSGEPDPSEPLAVKSRSPAKPANSSALTWRELIAKIKAGEPAGFEELHRTLLLVSSISSCGELEMLISKS